jgi:hypothetical protein
VFVIAAVVGFKSNTWIVVAALAGHGVLDAFHGNVVENSGVPLWWPAFCGAYDLGAAGILAWLARRGLTPDRSGDHACHECPEACCSRPVVTRGRGESTQGTAAGVVVLIGLVVAAQPTPAGAQDRDYGYQVGIRSALIMGSMELSDLDPRFDDLGFDGLKGPHISGFMFLVKVRPHVRVGIETLVANSDQDATTTMSYQAAGPVVELSYGASWSVAFGLHAGGLIVNAMTRQELAPSSGASAGSFYKGSGVFVAPYVGLARRFGRSELGVFLKPVRIFGESDRGGLTDFSAQFVGVRYALGF